MTLVNPPKMVFDERGQLVEVIVRAEDFQAYLRTVLQDTDWEDLPESWQDAVDRLLIDDVRGERADTISLDEVLADDDR
jgi:hypothetical protein